MTTKSKPKTMSDFERAAIRIEAWKAIEGWGHAKPGGGIHSFGWEDRCKNAAILAEWAIGNRP